MRMGRVCSVLLVTAGVLMWTSAAVAQLPEACCFPDGHCEDRPANDCLMVGGTPQGPGTMCLGDLNGNLIDDACEGSTNPEACCLPNGQCYGELPAECLLQGGTPQGPGSTCLGDNNGNGIDDACEGGELKFVQWPDINQTGIDVRAMEPNILADDFLCERRSLITHITVWGSWKGDLLPGDPPDAGDVTFTLSLHADIPAGVVNQYSQPGQVLWVKTFSPGEFDVSMYMDQLQEWWWDPLVPNSWIFPGDTVIWQYDFAIDPVDAFCQLGSNDVPLVYWLDVQAQAVDDPEVQFGWKTVVSPDRNFNDAAVVGSGSEPYWGPWTNLVYPMPQHVWYLEDIGLAFSISGDQPCEDNLYEYGDAPEDALAYPSLGTVGQFPTCVGTGSAGFIQHNNFGANLGPMFDRETEGNAGSCPLFNPNNYDRDECFQDGDAGLLFPPAYTITGPLGSEQVVSCTGQTGSLGRTCQTANWGTEIDLEVHNWMPNHPPYVQGYLNVLIDWNQDGQWNGSSVCPGGAAPEHVLVNFVIPAMYDGTVAALTPPSFLIGPNSGYVWMRCSITEQPVPANWDGSGTFEDGETEDYLIHVEQDEEEALSDLGDAPDSTSTLGGLMTAYPAGGPPGMIANYPTVYLAGSPPYGPLHWQPQAVAFLGNAVTLENEADVGPDQDGVNNIDPPNDVPDLDLADDGVQMPLCLPHCVPTTFNYTVNVVNPLISQMYVNVWFDWNRDGDWDDAMECQAPGDAPEWAVQNQVVTLSVVGPMIMTTPAFLPWHPGAGEEEMPIWMRISLSDQPWQGGSGLVGDGGSGPASGYEFGETEDYYFDPAMPPSVAAAVSRKAHGTAGTFDVDICAGSVECRVAGPTLVQVTFDRPIVLVTGTPADVVVSSGTVTGVLQTGPNTIDVSLSNVANATAMTMTFPGVADGANPTCTSLGSLCLRVLLGDVTSDGTVNIFDLLAVRNNLTKPVNTTTFRNDLDANGVINIFDLLTVRNNLMRTVGPCPGPYCQ